MTRKLLVFACSIVVLFSGFSGAAGAHVYIDDGPMTVFSHIEPDDDPVVGETASFFFIFADASNAFDSSRCDCFARIKKGDETLFEKRLFEVPDPTTDSFDYTLPEKGVYDLEIAGEPTGGASFAPFKVHRIIRAERVSMDASSRPELGAGLMRYALFGIAGAVIVALFIAESIRARKKSRGSAGAGILLFIAALTILSLAFHDVHAMEALFDGHCGSEHECCRVYYADAPSGEAPPLPFALFVPAGEALPEKIHESGASALIRNNSPPRAL